MALLAVGLISCLLASITYFIGSRWIRSFIIHRSLSQAGIKDVSGRPWWVGGRLWSTLHQMYTTSVDSTRIALMPDSLEWADGCEASAVSSEGRQKRGLVSLSVAGFPMLLVHDGALIREIVKQDGVDSGTSNGYVKNVGYDISSPLIGNGLLRTSGAIWKRHRAVMDKAFSATILQKAIPLANSLSRSYVQRLLSVLANQTDSASAGFATEDLGTVVVRDDAGHDTVHVDLWPLLSIFTTDFIGLLGFRTRFDGKLGPAFRSVLTVLLARLHAHFVLPVLNYLPTFANRKFQQDIALLRGAVSSLVRNGRQAVLAGQSADEPDILQGVLDSDLSEQQVCDEALTLLFAGSDTTSSTLAFVLLLLGEHPTEQQRVHAEIDQLVACSCSDLDQLDLTQTHFNDLPFLSLVIKETLRLYPPAIIGRTSTQRSRLPSLDLVLPDGLEIFLNIYAAHRVRRVWGDNSDKFCPDRMADLTDEQRQFYMPFGAAPRLCIGQKIAEIEIRICLFHLLRNFQVALRPGYPHYQLMPDITLHPSQTWVTLTPRIK